jgi:CheY-like chemotaxis protein/predicted regulator of Ras-like GTPase activity (Roadblock/LC7/MglB family)
LKKKPKILVVDDEESMVFSIQDYLSSYADCMGATTYDGAISMLEMEKAISLVISDIRMPDKDGFDLLMWLREHRPHVKAIMITAYGSPSVRALAKQRGAVMYLEKPLDLEQLMQLVRQVVERKGFSVDLMDMELADVLQFLSFANKKARVRVFDPQGEGGEIGLAGDDILWIRTAAKNGEEAFYEIMSWEGGRFEVLPLEEGKDIRQKNASPISLAFLLLEEARRRDEMTAAGEGKGGRSITEQEGKAGPDIGRELAAWRSEVAGFVESALINMDGICIAGISNVPGEDLSKPVAYGAKMLNSIVQTLNATKRGDWKEILITTDTNYVILQNLTNDVFLSLILTKEKGNLGIGRLQMEQLGRRIIEKLS